MKGMSLKNISTLNWHSFFFYTKEIFAIRNAINNYLNLKEKVNREEYIVKY